MFSLSLIQDSSLLSHLQTISGNIAGTEMCVLQAPYNKSQTKVLRRINEVSEFKEL